MKTQIEQTAHSHYDESTLSDEPYPVEDLLHAVFSC